MRKLSYSSHHTFIYCISFSIQSKFVWPLSICLIPILTAWFGYLGDTMVINKSPCYKLFRNTHQQQHLWQPTFAVYNIILRSSTFNNSTHTSTFTVTLPPFTSFLCISFEYINLMSNLRQFYLMSSCNGHREAGGTVTTDILSLSALSPSVLLIYTS